MREYRVCFLSPSIFSTGFREATRSRYFPSKSFRVSGNSYLLLYEQELVFSIA